MDRRRDVVHRVLMVICRVEVAVIALRIRGNIRVGMLVIYLTRVICWCWLMVDGRLDVGRLMVTVMIWLMVGFVVRLVVDWLVVDRLVIYWFRMVNWLVVHWFWRVVAWLMVIYFTVASNVGVFSFAEYLVLSVRGHIIIVSVVRLVVVTRIRPVILYRGSLTSSSECQ